MDTIEKVYCTGHDNMDGRRCRKEGKYRLG